MSSTIRTLLVAVLAIAVATSGAGLAGVAGASSTAAADAPTQEADCEYPVTLTDATETEVTIDEEPDEVVVTAQSVAQVMWEIDAEEKVTGMPVDQYSSYLDGHDERTDVLTEDRMQIDVEQVVDLEPDLVIAAGVNDPDVIEQLRDSGVTVYQFGSAASIGEVEEKTLTTGELVGACDEAEDTVDWMNERLDVVEETVEGQDRPSMLYWLTGAFTAGSGTFQHDLIELAGAENAGANMGIEGWQQVGDEDIVAEDPEYLLLQHGGDGEVELPDNEALQETTAVQEDNVVTVDANYFNQPAPRIVLAVEEIAEQLHPDAYEAAVTEDDADDADDVDDTADDAEETADDTDEDADDIADDTDDADDTAAVTDDEDAVPGFGVAAALVAVLGAIAALARRP